MSTRRDFETKHDRRPRQSDIKEFDELLLEERVIDLIKQDRFISRSLPTQVYRKCVEVYGRENIPLINFEDLIRKTERVLDKVSVYLGVEAKKNKTLPLNKKTP